MVFKRLNESLQKVQLVSKKLQKGGGKPSPSKAQMTQQIDVICVNGAEFVTGLVWNTITNARGIMSEARRFGRENSMDVVAIRERLLKAQAGYVGKNKGVNKDMYSLASTLAGVLEQRHLNDIKIQQKIDHESKPEDGVNSEGAAWLGVFEVQPSMLRKKGRKDNPLKIGPKAESSLNVTDSTVFSEDAETNIQADSLLVNMPVVVNLQEVIEEKLYYILAVVDGNVVPQSDRLGTFKEIDRLQGKINNLYNSTKKLHQYYFPADWNRGYDEANLSELLVPQNLNKSYKLKQLTWGMTRREIGLVGCAIVVGCIYFAYDHHQTQLQELENQRLQKQELERIAIQRKRIMEATGADVKINDLVRPWVSKPSVKDFIKNCHQRLIDIPPYIGGGWQLIKIDCQEKNIKLDYVRGDYSTVDDFRADVKRLFNVEANIPGEANGNRGYAVIPNAMKPAGNEEPQGLTDLLSSFVSQFQRADVDYILKTTEFEKLPKLPGQSNQSESSKLAPWSTTSFEVKTPYDPAQVFTNSNVAVVRIESIIINISDDNYSWTTLGKLYAKL